MRRVVVVAAVVLAAPLMILAPGLAFHSCVKCEGTIKDKTTDGEFVDGDSTARWRSAQWLEHKQSTVGTRDIRCYERGIKNVSQQDLTEIWWKAADFYRSLILASKEVCDPISQEGKEAKTNGPITIGPSNTPRYQTQVWAPDKGWPKRSATTGQRIFTYTDTFPFSQQMIGNQLRLNSGIALHFRNPKNESVEAAVVFKSSVDFISPKSFRYTYTISHSAPEPLLVRWSTVTTEGVEIRDERRDHVLSANKPFPVRPGETMTFSILRDQPPKSGAGPVAISDKGGRVLARGLAASHGPQDGSIADIPD